MSAVTEYRFTPQEAIEDLKIKDPALEAFKNDFQTPRDKQELTDVRLMYFDQVLQQRERVATLPEKVLQATGEFPIRTPYDALDAKNYPQVLLDPEQAADLLMIRHYDLWILVHPTRVEAMQSMEAGGFNPVLAKSIPLIDEAIENHHALTFDDLGFDVEDPWDKALRLAGGNEDQAKAIMAKMVTSAQSILARGMPTWITKNTVGDPYWLSSMPAIVGAHNLAENAIAGGGGFIPIDAMWNNVENQILMRDRAYELIDDDLVLRGHPNAEYIRGRARRLVGATLKANVKDIRERVPRLWDGGNGIRMFRVYDPRALGRMDEAVDEVMQLTGGEADVVAGPIVSVSQSERLKNKGASGLGFGIGEGGICLTPIEASLVANNLKRGYEVVKAGIGLPIFFDGGVGKKTPVALAAGGSVMKSQALGTGIGKPPYLHWIEYNGRYASLYGGEASPETKHQGNKLDFLRRATFVEGVDEIVFLNLLSPSLSSNRFALQQSLATSLIFARVSSVDELQHEYAPNLWTSSASAAHNATAHHIAR